MSMTPESSARRIAASGRHFRADLNGLRAWAVLAVTLYHFGVPGWGGGFIGVDVFFVISGFLMSGIVIGALERGDFSFARFYLARARRIVPALTALCAALLALGWFALLPPDYQTVAGHALYSLAFLSNIEYWREAGYFDAASNEKWLLHTWSLSVEWQFYLLLPVALWSAWRLLPGRNAACWTLAAGFALSLAASVLSSRTWPSMAFYLLPTRAWEMLAGGLVYLLAADARWSANARRRMQLAGALLLVFSLALVDKTAPWPGWRAALPVAATALILAAHRASPWTGNPLAQWLGHRAYSLYLWHWPVVVLLAYTDQAHAPASIAAGLLVTIVLGHFSHAWIEQGTRHIPGPMRLRNAALGLAVMAGAVAAPAWAVWRWHGVTGRFPAAIELVADEANNFNQRRTACHPNSGTTSPSCVYGGTAWKVLAVGDSHAGAVVSGLAAAAPHADAGVVQWSYSGCAFVHGMKKTPAALAASTGDDRCTEFIGWVETRLDDLPPRIPVVIINRYAPSAFGTGTVGFDATVPEVYFSTIPPATTPAFLYEFSNRITDSACRLARHRTVYLMRPLPEMGINVPKSLSRRMAFGLRADISVPLAEYRHRNGWVWAAQDAARDRCGVKILDPLPYLCHDGRCDGSRNGRPLYYDDNHMSESGNKLLVPMFAEVYAHL